MSETKKRGRPTLFTDELAVEVIERLSNGEPLAQICRDDHMPCDDTVRAWASKDEAFSRGIARAREVGFDVIAQRARQTLRGKGAEEGGESTGDVQRDKAIAEFDLKLLAKWDPKRYGDRVAHVGGGRDEPPIRHEFGAMSDDELQKRIDARLAQMSGRDEPPADA